MRDPLDVWKHEVPETTEVGLHLAVLHATRKAYEMCVAAFPNYRPLNYIVGQNRFTALQYELLSFGKSDPIFDSKELFHVNGMLFTQLVAPHLHLTTANVESESAHPQMSLFREEEQVRQLAFLNGSEILVAHLTVHVEGTDLSVPSSVRVHFPDGHGGYLEQFIDIRAKQVAPGLVHYENVPDKRHTPTRHEESQIDKTDLA